METILDRIAEKTRERIQERKKQVPIEMVREKIEQKEHKKQPFLFEQSLKENGLSFICEVKKASPSKGMIAETFPYLEIAKSYEKAGASAISCLTEPYWFQGKDRYLEEIAEEVSTPVLRKDFTVDPYMIYEAKALGADAVLLICALLNDWELSKYLELAHQLELSALVEAHSEEEVKRAVSCNAKIIGVNNRDLKTFQVDLETSIRLRRFVPKDRIYISESGIRNSEDLRKLKEIGTDGVLIGEALMKQGNKESCIRQWKEDA